jgi:hypothetical protein
MSFSAFRVLPTVCRGLFFLSPKRQSHTLPLRGWGGIRFDVQVISHPCMGAVSSCSLYRLRSESARPEILTGTVKPRYVRPQILCFLLRCCTTPECPLNPSSETSVSLSSTKVCGTPHLYVHCPERNRWFRYSLRKHRPADSSWKPPHTRERSWLLKG